MRNLKHLILLFLSVYLISSFSSCSGDDNNGLTGDPTITFEMAEYKVKVGKEIELKAKIENAINPIYSWKVGGKIISTDSTLIFSKSDAGEFFITLRIDAENGSAEEQVKVSVQDKLPPEINMSSTMIAYAGKDTQITAEALYAEDAAYLWRLDGKIVSEEKTYILNQTTLGSQILTLKVTNEDGTDMQAITVTTLPEPKPELFFDNGHYRVASNIDDKRKMTVPLGKSLVLAPVICNIANPTTFAWTVNGAVQSSSTEYLSFTPTAKGVYTIVVTEQSTSAKAEVEVTCTEPEGTYFRAIKEGNKATAATAFDYIPAPGQFVNYQTGTTKVKALTDAQNWLNTNNTSGYIHIGAFGGYWIVGFDHSVKNESGKADLLINGNAFQGWSEPGIIWVMQDENGNGLPDDTWYELKGSEASAKTTKYRYAITYYKPNASGSNVLWTDNAGNTGSVDYNGYHTQAYYFPMFISESYYTLVGTRLAPNFFIEGGIEYAKDLGWGYVDNYNSDTTRPRNEFWIEDAIQADGTPANLTHIDFVKVHTGTIGKGSAVGEISTEACVPSDLNFKK
jgi:hypothetical protein